MVKYTEKKRDTWVGIARNIGENYNYVGIVVLRISDSYMLNR